ncbi:MAG: tetratricopeptide repeat protein [Thiomicrorhabdus sp.]|jgi:putative thioredoxin|nr:tetratricopeptide repeat protein [Thiomicrorhabdus sp.]
MSEAMIVDVTVNNVQEMVIQNSSRLPVVINFWSHSNEQSKLANTILEKLATEMAGEFILAKINFDKEKVIIEKFGVTSMPFYKVVKNGEIVTEGPGLLPEAAYRSLLNANITEEPSEVLRKQAALAFAEGEYDETVRLLGEAAKTNPNNFKIHLDLVQLYLHTDQLEQAKELFAKLPEAAQKDKQGQYINGLLYFTEIILSAPEVTVIQANLAENSADCDALFHLAGYLLLNGKYEKALQTLFQLFYIDRSYQAGTPQKAIIKVFDMLSGSEPELVTTYRRKFQSLLY